MSRAKIGDLAPDTVEEAARYALLLLMLGISEDYYCAGWLLGLERDLWIARGTSSGTIYGRGYVTPRQCTLLRLLSEEADGWWKLDEASGEPAFVSLAKWKSSLGEASQVGGAPPAMLGDERREEPVNASSSSPVLVPMDAERIAALRAAAEVFETFDNGDDEQLIEDRKMAVVLRAILRDAGADE